MLKISIELKKNELFMKSISRELWIEIEKILDANSAFDAQILYKICASKT